MNLVFIVNKKKYIYAKTLKFKHLRCKYPSEMNKMSETGKKGT